ncbi:MAG TPA: T9SS type A sorting domain-containing protein, partial [Chitinophagaceae bacterium]|nr:T9SS type A sorting domain-containing protein [Chitinophagaceae bacterium]
HTMKQLGHWLAGILCLIVMGTGAMAQVQTPRSITITQNVHGFYEYLPQGYSTSQQYPLIIACHGTGEQGNGTSDLYKVANVGLANRIANGQFPTSFTVNGSTFKFIVISPQFVNWPTSDDFDALITYAQQNYAVNSRRIYLTGLSMGGGGVWTYAASSTDRAKRIAAIVPICGAILINPAGGQIIADSKLPVWATNNSDDPTVGAWVTISNVDTVNHSNPAPSLPAKMNIFNASGHDAWTHTYDPAFTDNGLNIYQWMLQYQSAVTSALPVTLGDYKAYASGSGSVTVAWTTLTEVNNKYFTIDRSSDGSTFTTIDTVAGTNLASGHSYSFVDANPLKGNNYYRLSQTDFDGKTTQFNVLKVSTAASVQSGLRISPNPVSNFVHLELQHPETGYIQVMLSDMQGRVLRSWKFDKQTSAWQQSIELGNLPAGNYTIQLRGTTIREVQQFVKQ